MKIAKKTISLAAAVLMASIAFTGCSTAGMELANAYGKNQTINSMESKTELSVNISASNLTDQEKQMMDTLTPVLNNSKLSLDVNVTQNQDRTVSRVYENFNVNAGQMPLNMAIWADIDLNSQEAFKEIIKMPYIVNSQLPDQFKGKEYLVMSSNDINNIPGAPVINYRNLLNFTKEYQANLMNFSGGFADNFNPGTTYIRRTGSESIYIGTKLQQLNVYQLKLTDASLKSLMRYTLNNLAKNPDSVNFAKSYFNALMSIYEPNTEIDAMKAEVNNAISNLPNQAESFSKALDTIDNLRLLGDDGIVITYYVNKEGYIVKEQGNAQFVIDLQEINKINQSNSSSTGIYTINLNFNTVISSINEITYINLPELNQWNSYKYTDLLKSMSAAQ